MKIIIDAMSGDNAPREIVKGAVDAAKKYDVDVILVGREKDITDCLKTLGVGTLDGRLSIVNAEQVVDMCDDPTGVVRSKKDSSMSVALNLLKDGGGDAVISAGNTGALLSGATLIVKRVRGIRRAAMAPVLPNGGKGVMLIDCGANVECTAEYLLQFAFMASFYSANMLGCENPRVGLLNVGTEDTKGTELQKEAFDLLKAASEKGHINFIGNVEASSVLFNSVDVVVTDGFSGNIMLKTIEGAAKFVMKRVKDILTYNRRSKLAALVMRKRFNELKLAVDPSEVGGTIMLGISKLVIKAHGSSDARAISNAVRQAMSYQNANVTNLIADNIDLMTVSVSLKD
jgi:glycerol-3-phosphate acyltransferase PlsX